MMFHVPSDDTIGQVVVTAETVREGAEPRMLPRAPRATTRRSRSA